MNTISFCKEVSAFEARYEAQKIAFGPVVFQCARIAWKKGLLDKLMASPAATADLADAVQISEYAVKLLLESCLSAGMVSLKDDLWQLEKAGYMLVNDRLTQVNFNYIHDVCWLGLADLETSLESGKPVGLRHLGPWATIYEGLSDLPEPARTSWFDFDHFYSDSAFGEVIPKVFAEPPRRLMDIGANTGKWALACLSGRDEVEMTLVDLPIQLAQAQKNIDKAGYAQRVNYAPRNLLDPNLKLPSGHDAIWMSQFLSCFSQEHIDHILQCAADALETGGRIFILDTFWDRQQYEIAAYCLINTSPYFTAMASGNSKIYQADDYIRAAEKAGMQLKRSWDGIGISHTLLEFCKQA